VDALLRGYPLPPEIRSRDLDGSIRIEKAAQPQRPASSMQQGYRRQAGEAGVERGRGQQSEQRGRTQSYGRQDGNGEEAATEPGRSVLHPIRVYPYGVARNRLVQAARRLGVPVIVVDDMGESDILLTLRAYYRKRQRPITEAEDHGKSIYVLRANTISQMQQFLSDTFNLTIDAVEERGSDPALQNTQAAIEAVLNGERWVELPPASSYVRRLQHQMARQANLTSHSYGKEPYRRVRIFRE
jgi:hypothetical protein